MQLARFLTVVVFGGLIACGDSSIAPQVSTGPDFPVVDAGLLAANCIRGELTTPSTQAGTLDNTDCVKTGSIVGLGDEGFYEGYRVRVEASGPVTLTVTSSFDNFLDLFLTNLTVDPPTGTLLAFDDDSAGGTDATLTFTLQPDTEYWVMISGFENTDVGAYTLTIS